MYDMLQLPGISPPYDDEKYRAYTWSLPTRSVLASYERGVRYVTLQKCHLLVWALVESTNSKLEWMLAHEADLKPYDYLITSFNWKAKPEVEMEWEVVESEDELISLLEHSSSDESDAADEEDAIEKDDKNDESEELQIMHGNESSASFVDVDESVGDNLGHPNKEQEEQDDDEVENRDGSSTHGTPMNTTSSIWTALLSTTKKLQGGCVGSLAFIHTRMCSSYITATRCWRIISALRECNI
jgi:hypothetical protein